MPVPQEVVLDLYRTLRPQSGRWETPVWLCGPKMDSKSKAFIHKHIIAQRMFFSRGHCLLKQYTRYTVYLVIFRDDLILRRGVVNAIITKYQIPGTQKVYQVLFAIENFLIKLIK